MEFWNCRPDLPFRRSYMEFKASIFLQKVDIWTVQLYTCQILDILLNFFINSNWKWTVLGSRRANIIWNLLRNGSGLILESLGIDSGSFFIVQVTILNMSLFINSEHEKMSLSNFKSHHLVINPDLGPPSKCDPGHDSIEDSSIIKSYWLKVGLVHSEKFKLWLWAIWTGGYFILVQPILPTYQNKSFLGFFILVHQKSMISWSGEAWDPESAVWHCTRIKKSRKF